LFRGIDALRDRTLFLFMLRCSLRVSQVSRLLWCGNLRLFSLDTSPRVVGILGVGRQHQTLDGPSGQKANRARSSINALA
jgi:site-specific recombinase XerC